MIMILFDSVNGGIKKGPHGLFRVGLPSFIIVGLAPAV